MPKYKVQVWREESYSLTVEAADPKEAERLAIEMYENGEASNLDLTHGDTNVVGITLA